jgi:Tol biopolymer transport system component
MQPVRLTRHSHSSIARGTIAAALVAASSFAGACRDEADRGTPTAPLSNSHAAASKGAGGGPRPSGNARIAFVRGGLLLTMHADGSDVTDISPTPWREYHAPAWSPDRTKLAVAAGGTVPKLWLVNADGSGETQILFGLPEGVTWDFDPSWAPDGSRIAVARRVLGGENLNHIWTVDPDGSNPIQITPTGSADFQPAWSPDGSRIAFTSRRDGHEEIYLMNADGSAQTRLTHCGFACQRPAWSPDGTKIAFEGDLFGGTIFVVDLGDPGRYIPLTGVNTGSNGHPAWSPDGKRVVFQSTREGGSTKLFTVTADGRTVSRATSDMDGLGNSPAWQ